MNHPTTAIHHAMWHSDLMCQWSGWRVVNDGHLALDLPAENCCSMRGAIKVATALCPLVWRVDAYSGGEIDSVYTLEQDGWVAHGPNSKAAMMIRGERNA